MLCVTPPPVNALTVAAPIKRLLGFPYIIGHQTINVIFVDFANGKVTVNAS
jgi:hypothetical protein